MDGVRDNLSEEVAWICDLKDAKETSLRQPGKSCYCKRGQEVQNPEMRRSQLV